MSPVIKIQYIQSLSPKPTANIGGTVECILSSNTFNPVKPGSNQIVLISNVDGVTVHSTVGEEEDRVTESFEYVSLGSHNILA